MAAARQSTGLTAAQIAAVEKAGRQLQGVGRTLTTHVTAPLALMAAGAVGAAMSWESAWAGVTKTVDGTTEQMSALEQGLRDMAKELPATHGEIAAVAAAAGQLGVGVEDIEDFTRVMLDLGETTNLSADEAATALARFMNIMGTSQDDVDRLGATIVDLGNNYATTESEIVDFSLRLAAAGRQAGLSETDVMAFGTALSSVGVNAEAGGTAFSKVFRTINDAVIDGGDKLETFARVAGMTSDQFRQAYERDAAMAIAKFVSGLGDIASRGESTTGILRDLGLSNERVQAALLGAGQAGDLLVDALGRGETAWQNNTALADEAAKRYQTTAAQFEMVRNKIVDLFIDLGAIILPVVAKVVDVIGVLAEKFQGLPQPLQTAAIALGGLVAAAGPVVYIAGTLMKNWQSLTGAFTTGAGAMSKAIAGLGFASAALTIGVLVYEHVKSGNEEARQAINNAADALHNQTEQAWANIDANQAAADAATGLAIAHQALEATLKSLIDSSDAADQIRDRLVEFNMTTGDMLDLLLRVKDGTPTDAIIGLGEALGYSEERMRDLVRTNSDGSLDWQAMYDGAEAAGFFRDTVALLDRGYVNLIGRNEGWVDRLQETARQEVANLVITNDTTNALINQAAANLGMTTTTGDMVAILQEYNRLLGEMTPEQRAAVIATNAMTDATSGASGSTDEFTGSLEAQKEALARATDWANSYTASHFQMSDALDASKAATSALRQAFEDIIGPQDDLRDATRGVYEEMSDLHDLAKKGRADLDEYGTEFDLSTEKGRAWSEQLEASRDAIIAHGVALLGQGGSIQDVTNDIAWNTQSLKDNMIAAGYTEDQVDELIRTYGLTPDQIRTVIQLEGERNARETIDRYVGMLDKIPDEYESYIALLIDQGKLDEANRVMDAIALGKDVPLRLNIIAPKAATLNVSYTGSGKLQGTGNVGMQFSARAAGGYIDRPEFALIGEAGPEVVLPLSDIGRMTSLLSMPQVAPSVNAAMGGGGNVTYELGGISVTTADQAQIAREARRELEGVLWRAQFAGSRG